MLISILEKINGLYEGVSDFIFAPVYAFADKFSISDWIIDAFVDSVNLIPFLFIVFVIIELIEFYYADRINSLLKETGKGSAAIGALAAIIPQCGFSVIASSLYAKRIITRGCLIAVYLATSDETIPLLLATPDKAYLIVPIVGIKLLIGICAGYLVDFIIPQQTNKSDKECIISEEGCCKHDIAHGNKRELLIHPLMHTANVFVFVLIITLIINYCLTSVRITDFIQGGKYIQPVIASFIGLIPNCAISIGITMMLIKGTVSFGAAMSCLLSNAGLGLLVLLKNNDFKDTVKIIAILLVISMLSGLAINFLS